MKFKFIFLTAFCLLPVACCFSQNWQWAKGAGGVGDDRGTIVCMDQNGNLYVTGLMGGGANPTSFYFQTDTFTVDGYNDFYLAKYNAEGNEIWVRQFGGPNMLGMNIKGESIGDIIYDPIGNCIYASGKFYQTCNFGTITLNTNPDDLELFLAKFDLNGNCIWAKKAGSSGDDRGSNLAVDTSGNIYMAGSVPYTGYFDTITVYGGFLAKYNSGGTCQWVKQICDNKWPGGSPKYFVFKIKYINKDIFMIGNTLDTLTIDTISFSELNYKGKILSQWDTDGNLKGAKLFGGPFFVSGFGRLSYDNLGNVYCTGTFAGPYATFGTDTIYSSDSTTGYIAKFDNMGNKLWVSTIGCSQNIICNGVNTDGNGNTYFTGSFSGNASFGNFNATSSTGNDIYIVRYDSAGSCLGVLTVKEGVGYDVISDSNSEFYITGEFNNTVNFGSTILSSHGNSSDALVAKHDAIISDTNSNARKANNQLLIYANPNTGKCNITVPDEFLKEENLTLQIFDNNGKLIQQQNVVMEEEKIKINLEAEAKGVYNVTLGNKKKSYGGKIVFE